MITLIAFVFIISPFVLAALAIDTVRTARRMGGQPAFDPTYRSYGA